MIDRIAQIQSRWQRVEAEGPPTRRKRKTQPPNEEPTELEEENLGDSDAETEGTEPVARLDLRV